MPAGLKSNILLFYCPFVNIPANLGGVKDGFHTLNANGESNPSKHINKWATWPPKEFL